eukprot:12933889-Prorocentrum_lima.AAC.1
MVPKQDTNIHLETRVEGNPTPTLPWDGTILLVGETVVEQISRGHGIPGHLERKFRRDMHLDVRDPVYRSTLGIIPLK